MNQPNIILFTTDQHRGDCIGLSPGSIVETPNLDGITDAYFPNAHTEIPSTTGARRIMLTGIKNHACGVVGYSMKTWDERLSVAAILAQNGYHCLNVGWRNLHPRWKYFGFHQVVPHELREDADDYWKWLRQELGSEIHERYEGIDANGWLGKPWDLDERYHATNWTVSESIKQLNRRDPTKPFFLWCSHLRPHSPYDPPKYFWDMYINRKLPEPTVGHWATGYGADDVAVDRTAWHGKLSKERVQRMRAGYYGSITHIDYQLGYFIESLKSMQLWDNSLFVFVSDHGDMLGDHHLLRKCYAYEGSSRIPFAVKYPAGTSHQRGTFPDVVGLQDITPTMLDAAGVESPDWVTGKSIFNAVADDKTVSTGSGIREFFHGEHSPCYDASLGMHYLTDGKMKYVWYPYGNREQLFDLSTDPGECTDVSATSGHSQILGEWRSRLIDILQRRNDPLTDGKRLLPTDEWYGPDVD
jgi:arylsulfatase